jgi:hypothetical protein
MPVADKFESGKVRIASWAAFKQYLDGTLARRAFSYAVEGQTYHVITDSVGGVELETYVPKVSMSPGADQIDFETNFIPIAGRIARQGATLYDDQGNALSVTLDGSVRRLEILGKVQVIGAVAPPATTSVAIVGDNPLSVASSDTAYVIPNGNTFRLQSLLAGNEDPTKGARVEVIFDNGGTLRTITRVYTAGSTVLYSYADVASSRDGTALVGNGAGTNRIILRRAKLAGSNIEIDTVVRGYVS